MARQRQRPSPSQQGYAALQQPAAQSQSKTAQNRSKTRLLDAALHRVRAQGYAATTVDDICREAGVTKGSFFHHFKSKDDLALAAVAHWRAMTEAYFAAAPYHGAPDPLDRLLGYLDFRSTILTGEPADYTCLLGTLVQETYATHPQIRAACDLAIQAHIAELTRDVEAARRLYAPDAAWSAESVSDFMQAVLQGSFILAKAQQSPEVVRENLLHLRRSLGALFQPDAHSESKSSERRRKTSDLAAETVPHFKADADKQKRHQPTEQPDAAEPEEYEYRQSHYTD